MGILDVDLRSPLLTPRDAELLRALIAKRTFYAEQGRSREAHGVLTSILIVWQSVAQPDIPIEFPSTMSPTM
jgi:hypothetical protein